MQLRIGEESPLSLIPPFLKAPLTATLGEIHLLFSVSENALQINSMEISQSVFETEIETASCVHGATTLATSSKKQRQ